MMCEPGPLADQFTGALSQITRFALGDDAEGASFGADDDWAWVSLRPQTRLLTDP